MPPFARSRRVRHVIRNARRTLPFARAVALFMCDARILPTVL